MSKLRELTGVEAGLSGDAQAKVALACINKNSGNANIQQIYEAVNAKIVDKGFILSKQGKASLRRIINYVAVKAGYIYPHDKNNPGWRITPHGKLFLIENPSEKITVINIDTDQEEESLSNTLRGAAFELYIKYLLKAMYPHYAWYHQGNHKNLERGLDFIGDLIGPHKGEPKNIGVQVKFHAPKNAPNQTEWLKFLAGCFSRRVEKALFITTGKLTGNQRREAGEANVVVIQGEDEVNRIASLYKLDKFELFKN